jgi:hypothetical protein
MARSLWISVAVVGLLSAGPGLATAHDSEAASEVTIRYSVENERFQGRVKSDKPSCERRRTVVVFRKTPGQQNPEVGMDRTNENGFWKVEANNPSGEFYARVLRRVRTPEGHEHVCLADRSELIELEPGTPGPGKTGR